MPKRTLSAQVSTESELYEEFEEFEEHFESRSEAVREALKRGIPNYDYEEGTETASYSDKALSKVARNIEHYAAFGMISAILAFVASDFVFVAASIGFAVLGISAAVAGMIVRILDYLERRPAVSPVEEVAEDA